MARRLGRLSDERLVAAAVVRPAAFGVFYDRYRDPLLAYFARRVGQPEVAADLMAEVFAAALLALHRGAAVRSPSAWLFGIARNALADAHRRGRAETEARSELMLEPLVLDDGDLDRIAALGSDVERALAALAADEREAVRARIVDERDYADIASELGCSEAVVRKRVSRGLARLRNRMEAG
jgi:RNA polymerase sigma factor (sigma-70 family)